MIAESRYFDAVFLGCLEDGEVIIHLVGLVVDENLDLLRRERVERGKAALQLGEFGYH